MKHPDVATCFGRCNPNELRRPLQVVHPPDTPFEFVLCLGQVERGIAATPIGFRDRVPDLDVGNEIEFCFQNWLSQAGIDAKQDVPDGDHWRGTLDALPCLDDYPPWQTWGDDLHVCRRGTCCWKVENMLERQLGVCACWVVLGDVVVQRRTRGCL